MTFIDLREFFIGFCSPCTYEKPPIRHQTPTPKVMVPDPKMQMKRDDYIIILDNGIIDGYGLVVP